MPATQTRRLPSRGAIYVEGLSDSGSKLSITNCHAPKHLNKWFLYAPSLTFAQLYYAGNTGMQTYGGTSIGIARLRRITGGTDPSGAQGSTIPAAVEWEMAYGMLNGHTVKYQYRQKTGHGLTSADRWKPVNSNHDIYDNDADESVNGVLVDIPYEGSTDVDNFYVLAPRGTTLEIPKDMIQGTYAAGTDSPKGWWISPRANTSPACRPRPVRTRTPSPFSISARIPRRCAKSPSLNPFKVAAVAFSFGPKRFGNYASSRH